MRYEMCDRAADHLAEAKLDGRTYGACYEYRDCEKEDDKYYSPYRVCVDCRRKIKEEKGEEEKEEKVELKAANAGGDGKMETVKKAMRKVMGRWRRERKRWCARMKGESCI